VAFQNNPHSVIQGATETIYTALSQEWEDKDSRHMSNLVEQVPAVTTGTCMQSEVVYAPWSHIEEAPRKLWQEILVLVGNDDK